MFDSISSIDEIFDINDSVDIDQLLLESIKSLAKMKEFYKAYGLSRLIQAGYESAEALIIIAENMLNSTEQKDVVLFLNKAGVELFRDTELWQQAELLCRIANNFHKLELNSNAVEYFKRAIEIARKGESSQSPQLSVDSSSVLVEIAYSIALSGEVSWALEVAEAIKYSRKKENALRAINSINSN